MLKYLRIAVTALSLTACALLIALWVRSYLHPTMKEFLVTPHHRYYIHSMDGRVIANRETRILINIELFRGDWGFSNMTTYFGVGYMSHSDGSPYAVSIPHWFLASLFGTIGVIPWIHWSKRFSLRTLLITMTLIALGLGAVIYLAR